MEQNDRPPRFTKEQWLNMFKTVAKGAWTPEQAVEHMVDDVPECIAPEPEVDLGRVREALRPFARYAESLKEWKIGYHPWQRAWPNDKPVIRRTYPYDENARHVCEIYVDDFHRAAEALSLLPAAKKGEP